MPKFDQTGPLGYGPKTGQGLGPCGQGNTNRAGLNRAPCNRRRNWTKEDELSSLEYEKGMLERELEAVKEKLKILMETK